MFLDSLEDLYLCEGQKRVASVPSAPPPPQTIPLGKGLLLTLELNFLSPMEARMLSVPTFVRAGVTGMLVMYVLGSEFQTL